MFLNRNWFGSLSLLLAAGAMTGCGVQHTDTPTASGCGTGQLLKLASGSPDFTLVPTSGPITIYPGQTEQISVLVQPAGDAQGTIMLSGTSPAGVGVSSAQVAIGSTATLTLTAANNVVSNCFTGQPGVFDANIALTLTGQGSNGTVEQQIAMDVVLENPAFTPAATNLPVLSIVTDGAAPIDSEDDYVNATLTITDPTNASNNYTGTMGVKGHGNSTWIMPKKPYRLNLDSKAPLLGMTSDSNWILLANYDDKAMIRNDVSFKMSNLFGMAWTPNSAFVEVWLNGAYNGTYQLTEKVEVSKARLNIGSIDDTDNSGADLTGGYLGEIDHYDGETFMLTSQVGLPIGIADPDPPTTEQSTYFTSVFQPAEASMYAANFTDPTNGWQKYWDPDSLVNWFLVEELSGNQDADDWSSDYFYKPRSNPLFYRGPVWDMDITFGNDNSGAVADPNAQWVNKTSLWYEQLFKDPAFVQMVKDRWTSVRPQALTLPAYIDSRAGDLSLAAQNNYQRWPNLGEEVWPNTEAAGTYQGEVDFMKTWLNTRIAYMDSLYLEH